jgi:hypothetical protein
MASSPLFLFIVVAASLLAIVVAQKDVCHAQGHNVTSCDALSQCTFCDVLGTHECMLIEEANEWSLRRERCDKFGDHCKPFSVQPYVCRAQKGCEWCESDMYPGSFECYSVAQAKKRGKKMCEPADPAEDACFAQVNATSCNALSQCTWCNLYGYEPECLLTEKAKNEIPRFMIGCDKIDDHCRPYSYGPVICRGQKGCEWCEAHGYPGSAFECYTAAQAKEGGKKCEPADLQDSASVIV